MNMSSDPQSNKNLTDMDKQDSESVDILKTDDEKAETKDEVDAFDAPKTDDDKITETDIKDDQSNAPSQEPEYTPPHSSASWSTTDETNTNTNGPSQVQEDENDKSLRENKDTDNTQNNEMSEAESKPNELATTNEPDKEDATKEADAENAQSETNDVQTEEPSNNDETHPDTQDRADDIKEETEVEPKQEEKAQVIVAAAGGVIEKEELEKKLEENEKLQSELQSTLSNQDAEREAFKKLTEENAKLQKHHDDMKTKYEDMEGEHVLMQAEIESFKQVNQEQREQIGKLETEVKILKESQGGDDAVKDLQEKLIRLSNEQEEKDKKIHSLEGELDATKEKLKDAESKAARNGESGDVNKSKTCLIM